MKKINANLLALAFVVMLGLNCTQETQNVEVLEEEVQLLEETEDVSLDKESSDLTASKSGDNCNSKPSSKYSPVKKMHIENKGSGSKNIDKSANGYCNTSFFCMNKHYMVLTAPGKSGSRTELKHKDYNMSLSSKKELRFTMILENVPSSSSQKNKGVSIGQIHNRGSKTTRPLLRVDATQYRKKIRVTYADTYKKGESDSSYDLVGFKNGDRIYIELKMLGNNKVYVKAKNDYTGEQKSKTFTVKNNWTNNGYKDKFYFKTGVYQQIGSSGSAPRASYNYFVSNL